MNILQYVKTKFSYDKKNKDIYPVNTLIYKDTTSLKIFMLSGRKQTSMLWLDPYQYKAIDKHILYVGYNSENNEFFNLQDFKEIMRVKLFSEYVDGDIDNIIDSMVKDGIKFEGDICDGS